VQLQTQGTLGWNAATEYLLGALCYASDGQQYISLTGTGNLNKDPTDVANAAYWAVLKAVPSDFTKAVDGGCTLENGLQVRWGQVYNAGTPYAHNDTFTRTFQTPFTNACWVVMAVSYSPGAEDGIHGIPVIVSRTTTGFVFQPQADSLMGIQYIAVGY
jgi:hypothetical protein